MLSIQLSYYTQSTILQACTSAPIDPKNTTFGYKLYCFIDQGVVCEDEARTVDSGFTGLNNKEWVGKVCI